MLWIIIILVILLIIFIVSKFFDIIRNDVNKLFVIQLYQMLKDTTELFDTNNIKYWISGGTLLGAYRHNGLIPWDDDADLEINMSDKNNVLNLQNKFKSLGYKLTTVDYGFKISLLKNKNIKNKSWSFPFIDIFLTDNVNGTFVFVNKNTQQDFKKCNFLFSELNPLHKYTFGELQLYGSNNPERYLDSCYGPDWKTHYSRNYNHEFETGENIQKQLITNYDMAKPIGPLKNNVN